MRYGSFLIVTFSFISMVLISHSAVAGTFTLCNADFHQFDTNKIDVVETGRFECPVSWISRDGTEDFDFYTLIGSRKIDKDKTKCIYKGVQTVYCQVDK